MSLFGRFSSVLAHRGQSLAFAIGQRSLAMDASQRFEDAQKRLKTLTDDPGNEVKLQMYGLFKQDEAKEKYAQIVDELAGPATGGDAKPSQAVKDENTSEFIETRKDGKIFHIVINRPQKKNALTREMYRAIQAGLYASANDTDTSITVISSVGDYFSSGNDLGNFMVDINEIASVAKAANTLLLNFVAAFIDHPKPLIGLVHGPALGVTVTTLALYDIVYASDRATFHAPFSALGQSPEGCSAYLFPRIMGPAKAAEFLLFGKKLTAEEAYRRSLVSEVFPDAQFRTETAKRLREYSELPPQSMRLSKTLIRDAHRDQLHAMNKKECDLLEERWQSQECFNAIAKFFSAKSKM